MESKGRRAPRAVGPAEPRAEAPAKTEPNTETAALASAEAAPVETWVEVPAPAIMEPDVVTPVDTPAELPAPTAIMAPDAVPAVEAQAEAPSDDSPLAPSARPAEPVTHAAADDAGYFGREALDALVESQAALTRGLEALGVEMAGLTILGIDAAARTATDMLAIKTLSDAIAVNAGFARSSFDTMVCGSAKLSELGVKLAAEASQPILKQLGKGWVIPARPGP